MWVFWAIFAKCILCCVWSLLILFHYFWLVSDLTKISLHVWLQKGVTRCSSPFKSSNRCHLWKPLWPDRATAKASVYPAPTGALQTNQSAHPRLVEGKPLLPILAQAGCSRNMGSPHCHHGGAGRGLWLVFTCYSLTQDQQLLSSPSTTLVV